MGMVDITLTPGAERSTLRLCVEKEATASVLEAAPTPVTPL